MSIAENLQRVRERIAVPPNAAGRRADEITLVGVTKYVGPREAAELVAAGCPDLGESRPQELWNKADDLTASRAGYLGPPRMVGPAPPLPSAGTSSAICNATKFAARCRWCR